MTVTFYFAIGRAYRKADLEIALAMGQKHFLVPAGSLAARRLRKMSGIHVALDSEAYPPNNPKRLSLAAYWREVLSWQQASGDWGTLDWFSSYDTIDDTERTQRDEAALQALIERDAPSAPLMRVVGYGMPVEEAVAAILAHPLRREVRPSYGIGSLAVQRYSCEAAAWYTALVNELERLDGEQLQGVRLHLFGIGRPSWILRSSRGLVTSFDSSGPARMAGIAGWSGIASRYTPHFGISVEKLQLSREARLYWHLCSYRRAVGQPWKRLEEARFSDDQKQPVGIQHAFILDDLVNVKASADGYPMRLLLEQTQEAGGCSTSQDKHCY
jgi:hypothetical protein